MYDQSLFRQQAEDENLESEEVFQEQMTRLITKEYLDLLGKLVDTSQLTCINIVKLNLFHFTRVRLVSVSLCLVYTITLTNICIWAALWQNQQNGMCAQRRLRSAWASAQSNQSLRFPHEESLGP